MSSRVNPFEAGLGPVAANFAPLSPVDFIARAANAVPRRTAIIHGERRIDYLTFFERARALASALARRGVGRLDTVAILAPNIPAMLEAHHGVPMLGAVLNPLNTRLDAAGIAFCLNHGEAKVLLVDRAYHGIIDAVLSALGREILVVDIADAATGEAPAFGAVEYEELLREGDPAFVYPGPRDELQSLCLLYTSGTTGNPKGVVYSHRGAYLGALSNALAFGLSHDSVYLWTLPMFHCSGWTYTWAVGAAGGTHVCLRAVEPKRIFADISRHRVSHLCGAPIVLDLLANAPASDRTPFDHRVNCATGGAAPTSTVISRMEALGFNVVHLYGTTECYGPSHTCVPGEDWGGLDEAARHRLMARQGVATPVIGATCIADPDTLVPVPRDGVTMGEIMVRGNTVMKGYLKNEEATKAALGGGWYRSGDLAVWHPDGSMEIKDRAKDVIISGGENISSIEVEDVLARHPAVFVSAVVAIADDKWGEVPCAFVTLKPDVVAPSATELIDFCRANMARFKAPKRVVFCDLPRTATGKVQKHVLREMAKDLK